MKNSNMLIIILAIIGLIVMYIIMSDRPIHNIGSVNTTQQSSVGQLDVNTLIDQLNEEEIKQHPITPNDEMVDPVTLSKLNWKNQAKGEYVSSSYDKGVRGNVQSDEWDTYFDTNKDFINDGYTKNNNEFQPLDETNGNLSNYSGSGHKQVSAEDLFKVDKLLPQEVKHDWFETMPEPIKVSNRHLVNVTKPVGINTISSSHKNPSYDLRGNPPCPKFVVSPFLNSSYPPDLNNKGFC